MTDPEKSSLPSPTRHWTPAQAAAINHGGGDLLVSAGAGSGKTAVLAERCARLVCDAGPHRCGIENLLVLTFTEAAANEMRSRIAAAIREKARGRAEASGAADTSVDLAWLRRQAAMVDRASISTLHAFCVRVLRARFHEARIDPGFEVMDAEEADLLREEVLDDLLADKHRLHPAADAQAAAFADFFEAYADGRDSTCRSHILLLHKMLASTADPGAFVAAARAVYAGDGADALHEYVQHVVCDRLRVSVLSAHRVCDHVAGVVSAAGGSAGEKMLAHLRKKADRLDWAERQMRTRGVAAWGIVRDALAEPWDRCPSVKNIDDFDGLKEHTWQSLKKRMEDLSEVFLAGDPAVMQSELPLLARPLETLLSLAQEFQTAFTAAKRAQNRVDFNDLERLTLDLLRPAGPAEGSVGAVPMGVAARELQERYHYLLVDEFQDINPLQAALLDAVRSPVRFGGAGNLFVVGDVKQSIYGFRLAEPRLFLHRQRAWGDEINGKKVIALRENFRSHEKLLAAMNGIFERLLSAAVVEVNYADGHAFVPAPRSAVADASPQSALSPDGASDIHRPFDGSPVEIHLIVMERAEADDDARSASADDAEDDPAPSQPASENLAAVEHEANTVAARIESLMNQRRAVRDREGKMQPLQYRDIAILLRTVKNKAMIFARALARRGIPAHADLSSGYFDTPEVRDTLALLHVLDNPRQDIPLATVLLGPFGSSGGVGFSHDDLAHIRLTFDAREVPFADAAVHYSLLDASPGADAPASIGIQELSPDRPPPMPDLARRLRLFFGKLARWRDLLHARPLHEGLAEIFSVSKILVYVAGLEAGEQRVANLQMLHQRALKFSTFRKQGLHRFLRFIEKLRDQDADLGEAPVLSEASNVVRIMSVHKSKGLEFPVVFASGLGNKLNFGAAGRIFVHRELGVGLDVVDLGRNVFYPSAASARIVDAAARAGRAEELRLVYVALTRARDHLILTGHVNKRATLSRVRRQWAAHGGPLPEDVLLQANTALDWILPAVACGGPARCGGLTVAWDVPHPPGVQIAFTLHTPNQMDAAAPVAPDPLAAARATRAEKIRAGAVLDSPAELASSESQAVVERLIGRVTGTYAHAVATATPIVQTVTFLKTLAGGDCTPATVGADDEAASLGPGDFGDAGSAYDEEPVERSAETASAAGEATAAHRLLPRDPQAAERARLRGVATHRVLELLDLAQVDSPAAIEQQLVALVERQSLIGDERDRADLDGIRWMLGHSRAGQRLIAAAKAGYPLRRELSFTWSGTLALPTSIAPAQISTAGNASDDLLDCPTIRGVIDALIVDPRTKTAEIVDYKTDAAFLWQSRLPDYQRQMRYYLRAAGEILGFPVDRATLLFLAAREEVEVSCS